MNRKLFPRILATFVISALLSPGFANTSKKVSEAEALEAATAAYIYGYPLITMEITKNVMTNVAKPEGTRAPMGQFLNMQQYPNASFRDVTAPNADTLYSTAWVDLAKEPYVLTIPDENGRYFLMPMLSGWTEVFSAPGKRTTGSHAQQLVIVGPGWKGKLPKELKKVQSPTNMVWILGRTYCSGTPEDYAAVHELQQQYKLFPLSFYGKPYTPPEGRVNTAIDMKTPVREQVNALDGVTFFTMLASVMKENRPAAADTAILKKIEKIGLVPGKDFDAGKLGPDAIKGLNLAVKAGQAAILAHEKNAGKIINGWIFSTKTGEYGTDYLQRAFVAYIGLGANKPQDAIYPTTSVDVTGEKLNGKNNYVIHFKKGEMPPVRGFWSLTMYDENYFFVENTLNKYTVSERNHLQQNSDGSVDLYIQHDSPGKDKEENWLPAPAGNFILMFRFYWPEKALIDGKWNPPGVKKI